MKELQIDEENGLDHTSKFYNPHPGSKNDLIFYHKKLKCLDIESLTIQGDYNSQRARSFVLIFEKCDPEKFDGECKSDEYIRKWLARKFIIVNMNNNRFSS